MLASDFSKASEILGKIFHEQPRYIGIYAPGDYEGDTYRAVIPDHSAPPVGRGFNGAPELVIFEGPTLECIEALFNAIEGSVGRPGGLRAMRRIINPSQGGLDQGARLIWERDGIIGDMEMRDWVQRDMELLHLHQTGGAVMGSIEPCKLERTELGQGRPEQMEVTVIDAGIDEVTQHPEYHGGMNMEQDITLLETMVHPDRRVRFLQSEEIDIDGSEIPSCPSVTMRSFSLGRKSMLQAVMGRMSDIMLIPGVGQEEIRNDRMEIDHLPSCNGWPRGDELLLTTTERASSYRHHALTCERWQDGIMG